MTDLPDSEAGPVPPAAEVCDSPAPVADEVASARNSAGLLIPAVPGPMIIDELCGTYTVNGVFPASHGKLDF